MAREKKAKFTSRQGRENHGTAKQGTEYKPWLHSASQTNGISRKRSKNLTRHQKLRHERMLEKAGINVLKLEKKVADSQAKGRRTHRRRHDWELLNESIVEEFTREKENSSLDLAEPREKEPVKEEAAPTFILPLRTASTLPNALQLPRALQTGQTMPTGKPTQTTQQLQNMEGLAQLTITPAENKGNEDDEEL